MFLLGKMAEAREKKRGEFYYTKKQLEVRECVVCLFFLRLSI